MLDTSINVKTDNFDGPLALLLLLIKKEEMDIRDLDLTKITKQYLDYLDRMRELNFDVAGEFLFMASTLLWLKSQTCVQEREQSIAHNSDLNNLEIATQSDLVLKLEELQHFQKVGQRLWNVPRRDVDIFVRPKIDRQVLRNSILTPMDLNKLVESMVDLMQREKRKFTLMAKEKLSIKEKLHFLKGFLKKDQTVQFDELLTKSSIESDEIDSEKDLGDKIVSLLSLLELARLRKIAIFQNSDRGEIYVNVLESLDDFDIDSLEVFDSEKKDLEEEAVNTPMNAS